MLINRPVNVRTYLKFLNVKLFHVTDLLRCELANYHAVMFVSRINNVHLPLSNSDFRITDQSLDKLIIKKQEIHSKEFLLLMRRQLHTKLTTISYLDLNISHPKCLQIDQLFQNKKFKKL